jgi:hypothetical protein
MKNIAVHYRKVVTPKIYLLNKFLLQAQKEFDIFKNTPEIYAGKVKAISNSFNLQKPMHLHGTELPDYWAGNLLNGKEKIGLVEINPEYNAEKIAFENRFKVRNWDSYSDFHHNLFLYYKNKSPWPLAYYQSLASGLANKTFKNRTHLDFLQETVVRFDILPYTSTDFNKTRLTENGEEYLFSRFTNDLLPFMADNPSIKKTILHNKILTHLLLKKNFINEDNLVYVRMNKGRNLDFIYKKNYKGLEIFIFSRCIPYGGFMKSEVYSNVFG